MLSCSIWFSAPSFWTGSGLESVVYESHIIIHRKLNCTTGAPQPTSSRFRCRVVTDYRKLKEYGVGLPRVCAMFVPNFVKFNSLISKF